MDDSGTDLFGLAQSLADRIHGMVSIENAQSHVLAYSASNDEADELRRLSILGRAGPPEHLKWIGQWGIFDALRAGGDVVRVAERPELGLRPRLAIGIYQPPPSARRAPVFAGTIWVQQGSQPLADDAEQMLRGAAVLAARIMSRLAARPSTHTRRVQQLLGLTVPDATTPVDIAAIAGELGLTADATAALIGWDLLTNTGTRPARLADVLALSASAFRRDAQVASNGTADLRAAATDHHDPVDHLVGPRHDQRAAHRTRRAAASRHRRSRRRPERDRGEPASKWIASSTALSDTRFRSDR